MSIRPPLLLLFAILIVTASPGCSDTPCLDSEATLARIEGTENCFESSVDTPRSAILRFPLMPDSIDNRTDTLLPGSQSLRRHLRYLIMDLDCQDEDDTIGVIDAEVLVRPVWWSDGEAYFLVDRVTGEVSAEGGIVVACNVEIATTIEEEMPVSRLRLRYEFAGQGARSTGNGSFDVSAGWEGISRNELINNTRERGRLASNVVDTMFTRTSAGTGMIAAEYRFTTEGTGRDRILRGERTAITNATEKIAPVVNIDFLSDNPSQIYVLVEDTELLNTETGVRE